MLSEEPELKKVGAILRKERHSLAFAGAEFNDSLAMYRKRQRKGKRPATGGRKRSLFRDENLLSLSFTTT
jgi:hypothetical protein